MVTPTFQSKPFPSRIGDNSGVMALLAQLLRNQQQQENNTVQQVGNLSRNLNQNILQGKDIRAAAARQQVGLGAAAEQNELQRQAAQKEAQRNRAAAAERAELTAETGLTGDRLRATATMDAAQLRGQTAAQKLESDRGEANKKTIAESLEFEAKDRDRKAGRQIQRDTLALKQRKQTGFEAATVKSQQQADVRLNLMAKAEERLDTAQGLKALESARSANISVMGQVRADIGRKEKELGDITPLSEQIDQTGFVATRKQSLSNEVEAARSKLRSLEDKFDASLNAPPGVRDSLSMAIDKGLSPGVAADTFMEMVQSEPSLAHIAEWLGRQEAESRGGARRALLQIAASAKGNARRR
jgi:hypothetical protein